MHHTIKDGVIFSEKGIPACPRWFADNRTALQVDETGLLRVEYRNPTQRAGNAIVFLKGVHDGCRYYLEQNGVTIKAEYENTFLWPFGMDSQWRYEGMVFRHEMYAVNDMIVFRFTTPEALFAPLRFKLEFNEPFSFIPSRQNNPIYHLNGAERHWTPWTFDRDVLRGGYTESLVDDEKDASDIRTSGVEMEKSTDEASLCVIIGADFPVQHARRAKKHILLSDLLEPGKSYRFAVLLSPGQTDAYPLFMERLKTANEKIDDQYKRYRRVIASAPKLTGPYKALNDFFSLAPLYHESLKVTDYPGALRAKTAFYGVWGWDGLIANRAALYWGDAAFIRDLLRFYHETAHPERGIAHAYRNDMSVASISELPSQGIFIILLHQYYSATRDWQTVAAHYPFAKKVFDRIVEAEAADTGFCAGTSLFPDFPVFLQETGRDISSFNNTAFYAACRSMEALSALQEDEETRSRCEALFRKMELHYEKLFFDKDRGFLVNSIDADTLAQRKCYSSNAVLWENDYLHDLLSALSVSNMTFFNTHFVCQCGVRPLPVWDDGFDGDANQLHSWWPATGEYYMRLLNENNQMDLLNRWLDWVGDWTRRLTIPEGIPCYIDTKSPELDSWDTLCGTFQAYSIRGFYQAAVHGVIGVCLDAGSLTFYPCETSALTIHGLHYLNKVLDIEMRGCGRYIKYIAVNGTTISGTHVLPHDMLGCANEKIRLTVSRVKSNPHAVFIKTASGIEMTDYSHRKDGISAKLRGAGVSRIRFQAAHKPSVYIDGVPHDFKYEQETHNGSLEIKCRAHHAYRLEINSN